jgi:hypothetical protein
VCVCMGSCVLLLLRGSPRSLGEVRKGQGRREERRSASEERRGLRGATRKESVRESYHRRLSHRGCAGAGCLVRVRLQWMDRAKLRLTAQLRSRARAAAEADRGERRAVAGDRHCRPMQRGNGQRKGREGERRNGKIEYREVQEYRSAGPMERSRQKSWPNSRPTKV